MNMGPETKRNTLELKIRDYREKGDAKMIEGFNWCLKNEQPFEENGGQVYRMSLFCNHESKSPLWSCNANIRVKAVEPGEKEKTRGKEYNVENLFQLTHKKCTVSLGDILTPEELENASNDLLLRWEIEIISIIGVRPLMNKLDFHIRNDDDDKVIIVDGKQLYVNKGILSLSSPHFKALFKNHVSGEQEIEITGVNEDDFIKLLHYIYPCSGEIEEENIDAILKVAGELDFPCVISACEKVLLSSATNRDSSPISFIKLLLCADQYALAAVQDRCIDKIKCFCQIRQLKNEKEYANLKVETKVALFEKALNHAEECTKRCLRLDPIDSFAGRNRHERSVYREIERDAERESERRWEQHNQHLRRNAEDRRANRGNYGGEGAFGRRGGYAQEFDRFRGERIGGRLPQQDENGFGVAAPRFGRNNNGRGGGFFGGRREERRDEGFGARGFGGIIEERRDEGFGAGGFGDAFRGAAVSDEERVVDRPNEDGDYAW